MRPLHCSPTLLHVALHACMAHTPAPRGASWPQALGFSAVLYWVVGVGGYSVFKSRTAGDLLRNFGATHVTGLRGAYERAIKLCYGLSILGSVPLVILPFYNIIFGVLGFETGPGGALGDHRVERGREREPADSTSGSGHGTAGVTSRSVQR